jgi:hypothetical protein
MKMTMSIWTTTWQSLGSKYGSCWAAYRSVRDRSLTDALKVEEKLVFYLRLFSKSTWTYIDDEDKGREESRVSREQTRSYRNDIIITKKREE